MENIKRDIFDPSWMFLEGTFDQQVTKLFYHVRLSKDQVEEDLLSLFNDIENTLRTRWPGFSLTPYGSLYQDTGLQTSHVDCCIYVPMQYETSTPFALTARDIFRHHSDVFAQLSVATKVPVTTATDVFCYRPGVLGLAQLSDTTNFNVPIVKFFHLPTNRRCDVEFNYPSPGVKSSQLIWYLLHLDKRAMDLAVLVKYWANVSNFIGPRQLRNYALNLMVIFYLQQLNMLPTVQTLQRFVPSVPWSAWNVAFNEAAVHFNNNQLSLKDLMGGFLIFYSDFNFEKNIISSFVGRPIGRERFKRVADISEDFDLYKDNLRLSWCGPLQLDTAICVQDVFDHSYNCCSRVSPGLALYIKECFMSAAGLFNSQSDENFLKAILTRSKPRRTVMTQHRN